MSSSAHLTLSGPSAVNWVWRHSRGSKLRAIRYSKQSTRKLHSDYYHLDNDQFTATVISHIREYYSEEQWANFISLRCDVHSPLLTNGHFLHKIMILVLMVFPACWMARLPSLYTLMMETVAYMLPPLITAVMTVPVITVAEIQSKWCQI